MLKLSLPTEAQEQKALVKWLSLHPILKNYFCKIDNEGKRSEISGFHAKLMGLRPGVADLFIYWPTSRYYGLWLEVKRKKNYTLSERLTKTWKAQELFMEIVQKIGYAGYFCYGWEDGKRIIERYVANECFYL